MVADSEDWEHYGVSQEVAQYIKSLNAHEIARMAETDVLLFHAADCVDNQGNAPQGRSLALMERMLFVARDFAHAHPGLAECHLRLKASKCKELQTLGTSQIHEYSRKTSARLEIIPLAVKAFQMLVSLNSPLERTQYVALAYE